MNTDAIYWIEECKSAFKSSNFADLDDAVTCALKDVRENAEFSVYLEVKKFVLPVKKEYIDA